MAAVEEARAGGDAEALAEAMKRLADVQGSSPMIPLEVTTDVVASVVVVALIGWIVVSFTG